MGFNIEDDGYWRHHSNMHRLPRPEDRYATALALVSWNRAASGRWPLITHLADIAVGAIFQWLSLGPSSSPFFTYFVFSLFCGLLRWGWRGTFRTAI